MEYNTGAPYAELNPQRKRAGSGAGLAIGALILAVCTFIGLVLAAVLGAAAVIGIYGENEKLRSEVSSLSKENRSLRSEVEDLQEAVEYLNDRDMRLWIADDMCLRGVTEDFCTEDVVFYANDIVVLDISMQPDFNKHYLGSGRFDVSDDELKGKLGEYVRVFEQCYGNGKSSSMTAFTNLELQISVYGYDVAVYKDGKLTLE